MTGPATPDAARKRMRRQMGHDVSAEELDAWLAVDPLTWVATHGPTLRAAGLSPKDAAALHRRLGPQHAANLAGMIDAGRMADIDIAHIHLWAASGLLQRRSVPGPGPARGSRRFNYTEWVSQARRYTAACGGNEQLAAAAAAAGFSVEETDTAYAAGRLDLDGLLTIVALREGTDPTSDS